MYEITAKELRQFMFEECLELQCEEMADILAERIITNFGGCILPKDS